jgi:acetyltransferase-like isoleucine patch superfamily enzyme
MSLVDVGIRLLRAQADRHPGREERLRKRWKRSQEAARLRRGRRLARWVRLWGGTVGEGLRVEEGVHLRHLPHSGWVLGDHVYLGRGVVLDVWQGGRLELGDRVKLMHYVVVSVVERMTLGDHTQVGECATLRDNDHDTAAGVSMSKAPVVSAPTTIGADAWIARGVTVTAGSTVGSGTVVGANAVVRGELPSDSVAVGIPARVIRSR